MKKRCSLMLAIVVAGAGWADASVIEKPVAMQDTMFTMTVSDLHGFIDGAGSVAAQVSPMASGMMIKNMAGMQLGDPGLAGIAPGKGMAVVALDATNFFAVIEVNEAQAPAYTASLSRQGMPSRYVDGVLVVAQADAQIEKGAALVAAVKETLLAKRQPALQITAQPAALIEKNSAEVDGMMQGMLMMMGMAQSPGMDPAAMQSAIRILEGEMRVLISLARQCDVIKLVLVPENGSVRIDETCLPKSGTRLEALLNAPRITKPNPKVQAAMPGAATIAIDCTLPNPEAFTAFISEELDLVLKEMGIASEQLSGLDDQMKKWTGIHTGAFSENITIGGDSFMNIAYAIKIKDEAETLALFKTVEQDSAVVMELYKSLGMPMTLEYKENIREHQGVKIHQFRVNLSMSEGPLAAGSPAGMNMSNMVCDVAICDGLLLCAVGDTKVETLIDRVKNPDSQAPPLKARSVYPADAIYYCDVDVGSYLDGISTIMPADPGNPMPQLAVMLRGAEPVTAAGFREGGMVMWSVNIPGSLLAKAGQAAMAIQMQRMQTMQQIPQQPPQTFEPGAVPGGMPSGLEAVPLP